MKKNLNIKIGFLSLLLCGIFLLGCEDFLEIDEPADQIGSEHIFEDETSATSAVTTLYAKLRDEVLITGRPEGLGIIMGLYSDEMVSSGYGGSAFENFYHHRIFADDRMVEQIWNKAYSLIYMCNAILEGINHSTNLKEPIKNQLLGETLFIKSLTTFYLVNLFGDIPLPETTDFKENSAIIKTPSDQAYQKIVRDLNEAKNLISTNYISGERIRANKMVVSALLARVYLYMKNWDMAAIESDLIISNRGVYELEPDLEKEFLKESSSAILQFKPKKEGDNTIEATSLIFTSGPPPLVSLYPAIVESMETNDLRKEHWIGEVIEGNQTWYYPKKYNYTTNTGSSREYSIVFRLSEQFLIRAEARAQTGNFMGALEDINLVRNRAGLHNINAASLEDLIKAIAKERFHELFAEFSHRWFDIKRMGMAQNILSPIKPGWKNTDVLLPIPEKELLMNTNLNPQNPGY